MFKGNHLQSSPVEEWHGQHKGILQAKCSAALVVRAAGEGVHVPAPHQCHGRVTQLPQQARHQVSKEAATATSWPQSPGEALQKQIWQHHFVISLVQPTPEVLPLVAH